MNQEQVIELAREAGFLTGSMNLMDGSFGYHLVVPVGNGCILELERLAALVAAHEREACAKVCEALQDFVELEKATKAAIDAAGTERELDRLRHQSDVSLYNAGMRNCAAAIRDRGNKEGV